MTYLLLSPQERPQYELSFRGNLRQLVEFKKYAQKIVLCNILSWTCPLHVQA